MIVGVARQGALPGRCSTSTISTNFTNLIFTRPLFWVSNVVLNRAIDRFLIDGMVNGVGDLGGSREAGSRGALKPATFSIYAFVYVLGVLGVVAYYLYLVRR